MSQQVLDVYAPLVKVSASESLPVAAIGGQTRDGKDEIILGTVPFVRNASNTLWVPVDQSNPLEVRVRQLEPLIGALTAAAVTDPSASASIIAALKGILTDLGQISDAMVTAGATGSISAKLRRLTNDVDQLLARLGQTSDAAADAGAAGSVHAKLRRLTADLAALKAEVDKLTALISDGALKTALTGSNVEILAEYQGYTGHNPAAPSTRIFGATAGPLATFRPLDVRRFGGLVIKITNGYNVAVTHRVVAFKVGEPGSPIWVDVTEDANLPVGAEFIYEIPNRYPYIGLRVNAPARDQTDETGLDVDIVGSVFYA